MTKRLKRLEISGFKSFGKKTSFVFDSPITAIVGPNGSGKSNCAEALRWVLGERSIKSLRGTRGEDLIFNGAAGGGRLNRAAVELVFDNSDRKFDLDFPEVTLRREVYRDGTTSYFLNGSGVRYRDVEELLAGVSLGAAEHFIISQGEADQVLKASEPERQAMVEDALGLRLYHLKIGAAEKKLEQTALNLGEVASLRREIAPHLRYLKKQVERIEQAEKLRTELIGLYQIYLAREEHYLQAQTKKLAEARRGPEQELGGLKIKLGKLESASTLKPPVLQQLESEQKVLRARRDELARLLGQAEGKLEALATPASPAGAPSAYGAPVVKSLAATLEDYLAQAEEQNELGAVRKLLTKMREVLERFFNSAPQATALNQEQRAKWESERERLVEELDQNESKLAELERERARSLREYEVALEATRERDAEGFALRAREQELAAALALAAVAEEKLAVERENFNRELVEGRVLIGMAVENYKSQSAHAAAREAEAEPRGLQEERRRQLERLKIKLEDLGGESTATLTEYREVTERDAYLAKEVADLEASELSLSGLIADLRARLEGEFKTGLVEINRYFQEFFSLMFGGGEAGLASITLPVSPPASPNRGESQGGPVGDGETPKIGLDIKVNLPRKKIRNLMMLSGGERSLVSIALLFAISQVNPPPFLVLDETDAALDEANSKKYGDLVQNLSQRSQLVLITHNRETMSRAEAIYGVTMSRDGLSQLLSIHLGEAVAYAK